MERLNTIERDAVASAAAYPMLPLVEERLEAIRQARS